MGYTHYWKGRVPTLSPELRDDVKTVFEFCEFSGISIAGGLGEGKPELTGTRLWFNGKDDESYETFGVEFGLSTEFDFCKTQYRPYDLAVVAVLELLTLHGEGEFSWSSDGDVYGENDEQTHGPDHADGIALAQRIIKERMGV